MATSYFIVVTVEHGKKSLRTRYFQTIRTSDMEKLVILNFSTGEVDIYTTDYKQEPDMDDLLDSLGHNANDCQWMFTQGNITFHKEVLK